ncbi:MAG: hypothetical protein KGL39_03185 [Patescibacteria group bacterium]|nr:hypothetical protein [Patescibacteria group bacterium]
MARYIVVVQAPGRWGLFDLKVKNDVYCVSFGSLPEASGACRRYNDLHTAWIRSRT